MAQLLRKFTYIDSQFDSTVKQSGWRLDKAPFFDPMNLSYGVVHDALEHHDEGAEGIEVEMMAFGSIYHIRVLGGWWEQFGVNVNANKMLAWDIARFLSEQNYNINPCPVKYTKCAKFLHTAQKHYIARLADFHGVTNTHPDFSKALEAFSLASEWFASGYAQSVRRWKKNHPTALTRLFTTLTNKVDELSLRNLKHMDALEIRFNTHTLDHEVVLC